MQMVKKYVVVFRQQGSSMPEYFTAKSLEDAHLLMKELVEEAESWEKRWDVRIAPAAEY